MSTTVTTHRRFSDPFAMAAAVVVIVGGATVIGFAASQGDSTSPTAPAAPVDGKAAVTHPDPSRVGLGDFIHQNQGGGGHSTPLKGGHTMLGQP